MKILLITQARISSSRLPAKVLLPLGGETVLGCHLSRLRKSQMVTDFMVATTNENGVEKILEVAEKHGFKSFQGSVDDVLDRFYGAAVPVKPDIVVRVTSDCPLIDPGYVDDVIRRFLASGVDYASNCFRPTLPDGADCEVFKFSALQKAWQEARLLSEREHVTPYIWKNADMNGGTVFKGLSVEYPDNKSYLRFTLDQAEDYQVLQKLVEACGINASMNEYIAKAESHPEWTALNSHIKMNEGYLKSIQKDKVSDRN